MRKKFSWFCGIAALCLLPCAAQAELPCSSFVEGETFILPSLLMECSGLARSHSSDDYFWAINDSGCEPELFLVNRSGTIVRTYRTKMTLNRDWEDLAVGPCEPWEQDYCIYIADTGDNLGGNPYTRNDKRVLAIREPDLTNLNSSEDHIVLDILHSWTIQYPPSNENPDLANPDAESMMVQPGSADVYIVSKHKAGGLKIDIEGMEPYDPDVDGIQRLYSMKRDGEDAGKLTSLASWKFTSTNGISSVPLFNSTTAADFAPDGLHFSVRTYAAVFEYDLSAYEDIAEAFQHPVERFHSQYSHQWEAVTYDKDGKSIITATENGDGQEQKMVYWKCVDNPDYTAPEPISPPDPLPELGAEPGPKYDDCTPSRMHIWNESCEFDGVSHCGSHDNDCSAIAFWASGTCDVSNLENKHCIVETCSDGYVPNSNANACICVESGENGSGNHLWDSPCTDEGCTSSTKTICEPDTVEHCGNHETACASIDHWSKGYCFEKACTVTECAHGFVPNRAGDACKCDSLTKHVWENSCEGSACEVAAGTYCEEDSLEHCGSHDNACANSLGWVEGECSEKQCVPSKCKDGFTLDEKTHTCKCGANQHPWNNTCEDDSVEHCGNHETRCADMAHWANGTCSAGKCVLSECESGFTLSGNVCVADEKDDGGCSSNPLRETSRTHGVWALLLLGLAAFRRRFRRQIGE